MKLKKLYSFLTLLTAFLLGGTGTAWGETITVANGTTLKQDMPFDGYNCDGTATNTQFIIPASELSAMSGGTVTGMKFYTEKASYGWSSGGSPVFTIKLAEVTESSLTGLLTDKTFTQVFSHQAVLASSSWDITFDDSYSYGGGNLLVYITAPTAGYVNTNSSYGSKFYTKSYDSYLAYSKGQLRDYLPKVTFTYEVTVSGPALRVYDGANKLTSGDSYSFGLATEGTTKTFTLKNPGTEATPVSVAHTGSFGTSLSAASIPAGGEVTLTVTMPAASGSSVITISSTAEGVDDFVLNVSGTVKDPNRIFETLLDGAIPTGWTKSGTWYWNTTTGAYNTTYYESSNYRLITPLLTVAEGETFYFDAQGKYAGYQGVKFEYSTDGTSWTASSTTTTVSSDWQTFMINDIPAGKYYIALHGWQVNIRNYYGGYIPVTPKDIVLTARTTESLTLNWTPAGSETSWVLQYSTDNSSWSSDVPVSSKPFELTGLNPSTKYYIRVRNAATSDWSDVADFRTECGAITSSTWTESFDGAANEEVPPCWSVIVTDATYPKIYASTSSSHYHTASPGLLINNKHLKYGLAVFPEISNLNTLQVSFWHKEESSTSNCGYLELGYLTNAADSTTFHLIKTCNNANATWAQVTNVNLSSVPAGARLAFRYIGKNTSYEYYTAIDDIAFSLAPACSAVNATTLQESAVSTNSATVSWTAAGTETNWKLQYKAAGGSWSAEQSVATTPSFNLTGLAENTLYYVKVKAVCDPSNDVESEYTADDAFSFRTDCEDKAVTELAAWTENFEAQEAGKMPTCWDEVSSYAISAYTEVNASAAKDGSLGVQVYTYGTNTEIALLPVFETEIKNLKISFDYKNYGTGNNYAPLEVGYYSGGAFTNVTTLAQTTSFAASGVIEMPKTAPDGARIAFRAAGKKSSYNGSAYIDNISVIRKPACAVPTGLSATASSTGASVSWTAGDEESQWSLRYSVKDADSWTTINNITATNYTLSNSAIFEIGTTYEVQVQAYCDNTHQSAWTASANFSPVCGAAPSALTVSNRAVNSATLTWTGAESSFKLQTSTDNSTWSDVINVNDHTYGLTGLTAGQTYYVRVQNACGGAYASTSFTTWCNSKLSMPLNLTSFTAIPTCWEESPAGAVSSFTNNKLCFQDVGEKFLYLPQSNINLNLLSVTFTFSGSLEFGYIDAPNGAFHAFASQPTTGVELNLEDEAEAPKYIAIRYNGAYNYSSASISAISIRKTPTCLKPTSVAGTPGVGSASISWTNGGSETAWHLQYKLASVASWDGAAQVAVAAKPYNLTGLEQGVSYKVRVRAACAGEDPSDWSDEASFTTECADVTALPWFADFSQALSACWTIYAQDETYYKPAANTYSQDLQISGGKNGLSNNVVVLPLISASLTNAVMSFEYRGSEGASYAQLEVGYMTDKADASTFQVLETLDQKSSYTEARVAMNTVPSGKHLAFRYAGASSHGDQYIKNLRILEQLTLADNANNSAILAAHNGKAVDVTIGRKIVRKGYYNTICLPFSLSAAEFAASPIASDDLWAFKYAKVDEATDELLFRIDKSDHIEAGVPYFIGYPADNDNDDNNDTIFNPLFKNVTISATVGQNIGDENVAQLCGIVDQPVTFAAGDQTKLFLAANNTLYWWNGASNSQMNAFRAYFKVKTSGSHMPIRRGMRARIVKEEQVATGVEDVQGNSVQSTKLLENNQVIIIRNGVKYNLQGQVIK